MDFYKKNILLVIHQGSLGGAERQGLGMAKILSEDYNCRVDVLLTFSGEMNEEFKEFAKHCKVRDIFYYGPSYLNFPKRFKLKEFKKLKWSIEYLLLLKRKLKPRNYEVIIPFLSFPSKISFYLYKLLPGVKFTFWHHLGLDRFNDDLFERIAIKNTPCIIVNAEDGLNVFRKHYKLDADKLFVLPQYLSMEFSQGSPAELKQRYAIPESHIVIGMIAHYRPEKLHSLLLNAFFDLLKDYDHIHLILLGNKEISATSHVKFTDLFKEIKEKELLGRVSLLSGEKVSDVLSVMNIGVLVSEIEGMPNSVMEYMLYGLPVVTTAHSGCKTLLGNSEFLIANNEYELYTALKRLIDSPTLRKAEGDSNARKIKFFNKESYILSLEKIMNKRIRN